MQIVNGYPCFTCEDVDVAKRHIDPATRFETPAAIAAKHPGKAAPDQLAAAASADPSNPAVSAAAAQRVEPVRGVNAPLASGDRGTAVNMLI
ncbi:MAG TPA: hypothetical protein VMV26_12070 [Alphaproteobacteria bacterium]|jgi:hypothetical protein|nr:hypothetical protein [Alphaproteobacteria bacterium]